MEMLVGIVIVLALLGLLRPMLRLIGGLLAYVFSGPPAGRVTAPPPTERQMAYIDLLCEEREVPTDLLAVEPETVAEASRLIDALKECPRR